MKHKNIYIEIQSNYHCIIFNLKKYQFILRNGNNESLIQFINENGFHYPIHIPEYQQNSRYRFSGVMY